MHTSDAAIERNMRNAKAHARAMAEASEWLRSHGLDFEVLTAFHIKIDQINYWPKTGSITIDGEGCRRPEKGLASLKAILVEQRVLRL